ncbi:MAG: hypothetical protein ACK4HV_01405 [Parachlamydiaceae bacterium]
MKEGKSDSFILKSKNFRILAGEEKESEGNFFSKLWAKVSSLWSKDSTKEPEDDLGYQIEVSPDELKLFAKNRDRLKAEIDAYKRNAMDGVDDALNSLKKAADDVQALETASPQTPDNVNTLPARDMAKEAKNYANGLQKQKEQFLDPKIEKAYKLADDNQKDSLFEANLDLNRAFTELDENPNDDAVEKLSNAFSKLSQTADNIINGNLQNRGKIASAFKIASSTQLLNRLEEPSYKQVKEHKWVVYAQAREQLKNEILQNEKDLAKYERGEIDDFNGAQRLSDLQALIRKHNDAVNSYNKD